MPPDTVSVESVPLYEYVCQFDVCQKVFYVCQRCDRGPHYCSPECRAAARRLQHRAAAAKYQNTDRGRLRHAERQHRYRQRQRARSENKVTDPSFPAVDSPSSCGCDDSRPVPQSSQTNLQPPPPIVSTAPQPIPPHDLHCHFCGCRGYLQKRDADEPDCPARHP